jgi:hypothetical protein
VAKVGTTSTDSTEIFSQLSEDTSELVTYQIEKMVSQDTITLNSDATVGGNLVEISKKKIRIILESRTKYQVRVKSQYGAWSAWVQFKTRGKRYQSPDAITQLSDNTDRSAVTNGPGKHPDGTPLGRNRTIEVLNGALATVTDTVAGALVVNEDPVFNDTQLQVIKDNTGTKRKFPIRYTDRGATIVNDESVTFTNRGATINSG